MDYIAIITVILSAIDVIINVLKFLRDKKHTEDN